MKNVKPINGNILIKFPKEYTNLVTKSGIVLPQASEQDINVAEVVAIPENRTYIYEVRKQDGTPIRNDDGSIKEDIGTIQVKPGDKILMEKKFHHDYDFHRRIKIDRTIEVDILNQEQEDFIYALVKYEDILATYDNWDIIKNEILGETFYSVEPKKVTKAN
jgi:co-chaperonin GroES (HSP10)